MNFKKDPYLALDTIRGWWIWSSFFLACTGVGVHAFQRNKTPTIAEELQVFATDYPKIPILPRSNAIFLLLIRQGFAFFSLPTDVSPYL